LRTVEIAGDRCANMLGNRADLRVSRMIDPKERLQPLPPDRRPLGRRDGEPDELNRRGRSLAMERERLGLRSSGIER
jgi:hypothetical protein